MRSREIDFPNINSLNMLRAIFSYTCISLLTLTLCLAQTTPTPQDSLKNWHEKSFEYQYAYDYKNAIRVCDTLVDRAIALNELKFVAKGYVQLGGIHLAIGDTVKGRSYYLKALDYAQRTADNGYLGGVYNDLGNVYAGNTRSADTAINYYKKSIALKLEVDPQERSSIAPYMNIGWSYLDRKKPTEALPFLDRAVEIFDTNPGMHPLYRLNTDILYGRYFFYIGNYPEAILMLENTARQALEGNYLEQNATSHLYLSQSYENLGNYSKSLASYKTHKRLLDELNTISRESQLLEMSSRFNLEQVAKDLDFANEQQSLSQQLVSKTNQTNFLLWLSTLIFLLASILIYMLFRNRKQFIGQLQNTNKALNLAKEKAENLARVKSNFFSTVSHELRTPLYGVIGLSSILLEDPKLESHKEDLNSLKFSADYLLALINDVLSINKADAQGLKLNNQLFQLSVLIENIKSSLSFGLQQNNNTIQVKIDSKIPDFVIGDYVKLSQVLMNLAGNAVKFNENGQISISADCLESQKESYTIRFKVSDDGVGIPKEMQARIFDEFQQGESHNSSRPGTGLGLAIVKRLLDVFDSQIHLQSLPNEGATFWFDIKMKAAEVNMVGKQISTDVLPAPLLSGPLKALIVDDNKINLKVTERLLHNHHLKCDLAQNGLEAIEKTKNGGYDFILMDINMPQMDGIEATLRIREFDKDIPIFALTAVEIDEIRKEILDAGMNDIILKPYDTLDFLNTIFNNLKQTVNS